MIRYADDKAVVASSQKGLQELMNRLNAITKEYDCIGWKGKSKVRLLIDDQQTEQVSQFNYLGIRISDDGSAT